MPGNPGRIDSEKPIRHGRAISHKRASYRATQLRLQILRGFLADALIRRAIISSMGPEGAA